MIDFLLTPTGAALAAPAVAFLIWYIDRMTGLVRLIFGIGKTETKVEIQQTAITTPTDEPAMVMSRSVFEAELQKRAAEVEEALQSASEEERSHLLAQQSELQRRLSDVEAALQEREAKITDLTALLQREGNEIGGDRLQHAIDALERGDFSEADEIFAEIEAREALAVDRAARAAFGRGEIAEEQIRWLDAAEHYKRAATLAPDYDRLERAGTFLWRAGRSGEAVRFEEDLVALSKRTHGVEAAQTATALNNLAASYRALGRFEEAEPLYRQAIEIDEATLGTAHPDYATGLNNLALLLQDMGRFEEAEPLYRSVVEILPEDNDNFSGALNNLALLLRAMGRLEEAEPLFRQAIEIDEATIGTAHPDYATGLNNLARLLRDMGRLEEAEPLNRQAMEIREAALGTAHPDYAQSLNNLALLLWDMGRLEEAAPLFDQAVAILEDRLGAEHPTSIKVTANREAFRAERASSE
ncbi:MAG: tetratricopeptide repeat protein [Pseudomonadota bacterium]